MKFSLSSIVREFKQTPLIKSYFKEDRTRLFFRGIGALTVGYFALKLGFSFSKYVMRQYIARNLIDKYGENSWAVVTGATDEIGRAFCHELAKEGFNIVLIARKKEKLNSFANELKRINPVIQTKVILSDFLDAAKPKFFENLYKELDKLDISILINNTGYYLLDNFENMSEDQIKQLIIVNSLSNCLMTRSLITKLSKRKKKSAIINLSSMFGIRPAPYASCYGAAKAFNDVLSRGLAKENPNIDIISLRPFYVQIRHSVYNPLHFHIITPSECARNLFEVLGTRTETSAHWKHDLQGWFVHSLPEFLYLPIIRFMTRRRIVEHEMPHSALLRP